MTPFDYVYAELGIKCGLSWFFTTPAGLYSLVISVIFGLVGTWLTNKIEP